MFSKVALPFYVQPAVYEGSGFSIAFEIQTTLASDWLISKFPWLASLVIISQLCLSSVLLPVLNGVHCIIRDLRWKELESWKLNHSFFS